MQPMETETHTEDFGAELEEQEEFSPLPLIGKTTVDLPGGYGMPDGSIVRTATVRELTGFDEEQLARADVKQPLDFVTKLVLLGTAMLGDQPLTHGMLDSMLLGDRDALVLGIRAATFGEHLEYKELVCPSCQRNFDVDITLDEIPMKKLDDPMDRTFEVTLLRGQKATVRLATHGDLAAMLEVSSRITDQNTELLSRCVLTIGRTNVQMNPELPEDIVKKLNMRDRQLLINEMSKRQPGPDFEGVKILCPGCGFEDRLIVDPIGLFRL